MATPGKRPPSDTNKTLTESVESSDWREVLKQVGSRDCSQEQRQWAMAETVKRAPEWLVDDNIVDILDNVGADEAQLGEVVAHLLRRRLWECVGQVLCRGNISGTQHRWVIEESVKHASGPVFSTYVFPHCVHEELELVLTHLVSQGQWWLINKVLTERDISLTQHRWVVEEAVKHAEERKFASYILHHCKEEELEQVLTHMVSRGLWMPVDTVTHSNVSITQHLLSQIVSRGMWEAVGWFLQRDISRTQHMWAVEQASIGAGDVDFVNYIFPHCHDEELERVTIHLLSRGMERSIRKVLERDACTQCLGVEVEHVITPLVSHGLWRLVDKVLKRGTSTAQHKWAVEEALKRANEREFADCILHHCAEKELEQVLTHMVSRGLWEPVDSAAQSDTSITHHILSQIVPRGRWKAVGRFLQRDIGSTQHRMAIEQASRHAGDDDFVDSILPHCHDNELGHIITVLVSRGLWRSIDKVLERGIGAAQHRQAVEEALKLDDELPFAEHILHHCAEEELEHVLIHMLSQDLWEPVDSVIQNDPSITQRILSQIMSLGQWEAVGRFLQRELSREQHMCVVEQASRHAADDDFVDHILPQCHNEELEHIMTNLVSRHRWMSVSKALERDINPVQCTRAVEQASRHADDDDFVDYILPQCDEEDLENVITVLVSRGLWWAVGEVLERGIGTAQHSWAVREAARHAEERTFVDCILHHCIAEEELEQVLTHMVSRGLWEPVDSVPHSDASITHHILSQLVSRGRWKAVGKFLRREKISGAQHRRAVEQASKHAGGDDFVCYIFPECHGDELQHALTHLMARSLGWAVGKVLERGIKGTQRSLSVVEWAAKHTDDVCFDRSILRHSSEDEIFAVFPHLVANRKWICTRHVLYDMVRGMICIWITSGHDSRAHDTLFWKFMHRCRVQLSLALDLTKAVTQEIHSIGVITSDLAVRVSWQRALCESLMTSLLHTLCHVLCSDDREHTVSTDHTKQCISDMYTHITACIKDNAECVQDNTLKTIQNRIKWISVFTEIADTHKADQLFFLHFLQSLNLYHASRQGENHDAVFLVMLAVFPLFPQLQSVALRMMLREKRWDVIRRACLSHVWEHDRRQLFKAAVEQRQWSVVRQWSGHTVHDDQREWAMKEAFKEEEWEVYLLLADHGLTVPEQMHAHYMVAKYGDWDTVLQMVERGGDITEVSDLLENWVTGRLRKKPQGDVSVYMKRCENLIRMRLRFAKEAVLSPMKALNRCKWGSVLFNVLHEPTEDYFSRVLDKVIEQREWHILMHLVRLEMNAAERNWLFPEMVKQQQWGVCRMLLEYGVDDQLCVEALPELMERNQWTLVARVMEYDVDDAVRHQVMQCAFQRREGALFWHCLNVMNDKQPLTKETQVKLFHQAISRDIWQAVKPLMVEKDGPRIQHRDMAFLEAIEQHLWDVVDYCQLYRADINMKDENGETPLHREARKEEWKAVEEIVLRDGKPNLLDKDGFSVSTGSYTMNNGTL